MKKIMKITMAILTPFAAVFIIYLTGLFLGGELFVDFLNGSKFRVLLSSLLVGIFTYGLLSLLTIAVISVYDFFK